MIKEVVILAGGEGSRIWPYGQIRNKVMIPVSNRPIIDYNISALLDFGVERILVIASKFASQIRRYYKQDKRISVLEIGNSLGSGDTLLKGFDGILSCEFGVFYGDTIIERDDLKELLEKGEPYDLLLAKWGDENEKKDEILCEVFREGEKIKGIKDIRPYPRSGNYTHFITGFVFDKTFKEELICAPQVFTKLSVGVMPKVEYYLESVIQAMLTEGRNFRCFEAQKPVFDIDKPWHILVANQYINKELTGGLKENILLQGAEIDETAEIRGYVKIGENSRIGRNVIIEGNVIVGDNTVVENGAVLGDGVIIGKECIIKNYCLITGASTIGNRCIVEHGAEVYSSLIMDHVYLYHYGEFMGIIGENTDIGAATVCGTLRFDDGATTHNIKGRREKPRNFANCIFLGDYSRTGVNAIVMPGIKTGVYSIVGSGVLLQEDLEDNTCIFVKQELHKIPWGPEKYGY